MTKRSRIASAFAVAAVLLAGAGAVAAAHTLGGLGISGPAVAPADHPAQPPAAHQPQPADIPGQPGVTQTPEPEDGPDGPGDTNEGPGE